MKVLETSIEIDAPRNIVWSVLTNFDSYPDWNPFIRSFKVKPNVGERFSVELQQPGGKAMIFNPTCLVLDENREFRWLGRLIIKGLFDGEHIFLLEELEEGRTHFIHKEEFRGILVPLLWNQLNTKTREGFERMNQKLKERAEERA